MTSISSNLENATDYAMTSGKAGCQEALPGKTASAWQRRHSSIWKESLSSNGRSNSLDSSLKNATPGTALPTSSCIASLPAFQRTSRLSVASQGRPLDTPESYKQKGQGEMLRHFNEAIAVQNCQLSEFHERMESMMTKQCLQIMEAVTSAIDSGCVRSKRIFNNADAHTDDVVSTSFGPPKIDIAPGASKADLGACIEVAEEVRNMKSFDDAMQLEDITRPQTQSSEEVENGKHIVSIADIKHHNDKGTNDSSRGLDAGNDSLGPYHAHLHEEISKSRKIDGILTSLNFHQFKSYLFENSTDVNAFHHASSAHHKKISDWCPQINRLVHSNGFQLVMIAAIFGNVVLICIVADAQMDHYISKQGGDSSLAWVRPFDLLFLLYFILEIILRVIVDGMAFWCGTERFWNILDVVTVVASVPEEIGYLFNAKRSGLADATFLRVVRIFRLARALKMFRVVRFFRELRVMMSQIVGCALPLMWAMILVLIIFSVFAIAFLTQVAPALQEGHVSDVDAELVVLYFRNIRTAILSLFMAVSGGTDWMEMYLCLSGVSWWVGYLFIFYEMIMVLGALNIVVGLFVDSTRELAIHDRDLTAQTELEKRKHAARALKELFESLDDQQTGHIGWKDFHSKIREPDVAAYLSALDLDVAEAAALFSLLDVTQNGSVELEEFVFGCMRLKGPASEVDMRTLLVESKQMQRCLCKGFDEVSNVIRSLEVRVGQEIRTRRMKAQPK